MSSKDEVLRKIAEGKLKLGDVDLSQEEVFTDPAELDDYQKIIEGTGQWSVPETRSSDELWSSLMDKLDGPKIVIWRRRWLSIAATFALLLSATYFFVSRDSAQRVISSGPQEIVNVTLPDGSKVILNALSTVEFNEDWKERIVSLQGKARFEVETGERFIVKTGSYRTMVTGTAFDVQYEDLIFEVSCYSGSVKVMHLESEISLSKGQKAFFREGTLQKADFDTRETAKWVEGEFYFAGTPLMRVIREMEKQLGIEIRGIDDDNRLYKGYFYKNDVTEALDLVFRPMGYDYKIEGNIVTVK